WVQFSPDGRRILTGSTSGTRVWDMVPSVGPCPDWLLRLARAMCGNVLNERGLLEPTTENRLETINEIRELLIHQTGDSDWLTWGRWLLAESSTRTISHFSSVTVL